MFIGCIYIQMNVLNKARPIQKTFKLRSNPQTLQCKQGDICYVILVFQPTGSVLMSVADLNTNRQKHSLKHQFRLKPTDNENINMIDYVWRK